MASLIDFCDTDSQRELVKAVEKHGSVAKAAKAIGRIPTNAHRTMRMLKARAASHGHMPDNNIETCGTPRNFPLDGFSLLTKTAGGESIWLKAKADKKRQYEIYRDFAERLSDGIKPLKPRRAPRRTDSDLLNAHYLTDYHFGMLAWPEETGAPWDTKLAEQMIVDWFADALRRSPKAETGLLAELGDLLHFDSLDSETPASRHVLDADSRYQRVVDVVLDSMQRVVDMMLQKYQRVHIIVNDGNHDPAGSVWLRAFLRKMYAENPRLSLGANHEVTVDRSPATFNAFEWGATMLAFHHGHKLPPEKLTKVIAGMFREMFGRTKYAYGNSGHLHHLKQIEDQLMQWRQHPTMAARDAYASRGGYISQRMGFTTTYSKQYGYESEIVTTPEMLERAA